MENAGKYPGQLVFGLDIGTRSIVGTVGYKKGKQFVVVAQTSCEHETRAMLDGQIHDIGKVSETIRVVKDKLEKRLNSKLKRVCIAAAGRVLKTMQVHCVHEMEDEHAITEEDIYTLHSIATEEAYKSFLEENNTDVKFYCVGSSAVRYYLNDFPISNLLDHKGKKIGIDMITTFLPDEVVDGLNKAVELAGLEVENLTLEPIAAIQLAIPEKFRLLNIALVDVGAGTSDISITKDGTIIAFGMIPIAGDCLTELIANHCMVDFATAEYIKRMSDHNEEIEYSDIMGIKQTISCNEVAKLLNHAIEDMTNQVADKIIELNGGKSVGAVFVVGGGGIIPGYTSKLAKKLSLADERVALRGKEVMQDIVFEDSELKADSLLVTPIGICLNFYEQSNHFIYVVFNDERVKLYNNKMLTVMDAAMQTDFPSTGFFPRSGKEINYFVDGKSRIARGEMGEAATIIVNNNISNLHTQIKENDIIQVSPSSAGKEAHITIEQLPEFSSVLRVKVNNRLVELPKYAQVNGILQSGYYEIKDNDNIEFLNYYTVEQIKTFMDIRLIEDSACFVNNKPADHETKVYENFEVSFQIDNKEIVTKDFQEETKYDTIEPDKLMESEKHSDEIKNTQEMKMQNDNVTVTVNGDVITMSGKEKFVFVDIFNYISFDLSKPQGVIVTKLNGRDAGYMETLYTGDVIEIYWRKP